MNTKLSRRTALMGMAGALGSAGLARATPSSSNTGKGNSHRIEAEQVLQIHVQLGETEDMGSGADGHRINYPIIGGHFQGQGLKGVVVPGGADMSVERNDGVTLIEALYRLRTDDNQVIIIHNPGVWRPNQSGLQKLKNGQALLEEDYYCLTTPSFKTPPGKYNWLTQSIFVGTIDDINDYGVLIGCYRMSIQG
ncbi:DUF3237 domain-containing protein [Pseudomaricurvus alkylphenolicus]|uniref:DUF3237 domain-containing protein n=1 Tax=Pseudomaricurvus alkylphenolicus TaxID=1306991 RepID=UPI00141E1C57|nr:DUF3237 domain-containing protein [Pseudomaricurvus alkylphenolicus]NIB43387.1 DUF3237 domain-containing protein [Pseudomaricurvus alkylphenolicus]